MHKIPLYSERKKTSFFFFSRASKIEFFDCQSTNYQKWSQKNAKNKKSSWMQNKKNTMQRYCERLEKRLRTNEMSEVLIDE